MKKFLYSILLVISLFVISSAQEVVFADELTTDDFTNENIELDVELNLDLINQLEPSLEISPQDVPNENYYPGTSTYMKPGDILYSSKSFLVSTKIVGHVGIVGPDYRIYHVNPAGAVAGKRDTLATYRSRHDSGEKISVYRPTSGGAGAANWASNNYESAINYDIINLSTLSKLSPNYCSKFIWQAFYYGGTGDITGNGLTGSTHAWVTPSHIKNANLMFYLTSFKVD